MIRHPNLRPLARKDRLGRHRLYRVADGNPWKERPGGVQVADGRGGGPGAGPTRWRFRGTPPPFPGIGAFLPETLHLPQLEPEQEALQIFGGPSARRTRPATTTTTMLLAVVAELGAVDPLQLLAPPAGPTPSPPCPCQLDEASARSLCTLSLLACQGLAFFPFTLVTPRNLDVLFSTPRCAAAARFRSSAFTTVSLPTG